MKTVFYTDFPYNIIRKTGTQKRKKGNPGTSRKAEYFYKDAVCAFDIETTRHIVGNHRAQGKLINDEVSIMYIWQFQYDELYTVYGRTWEDFDNFILKVSEHIKAYERLVIYVHNLSYEFSFLQDDAILGKYIDDGSVFCMKARKILKFTAFDGKLEFRCSYIHSNMSLDLFTSKMGVEHKKLSGTEFNYNKKRYPWTELTEKEKEYCFNDVRGLVEALKKEMTIDGDNLYTICLTSTGYVRRDIRDAIKNAKIGKFIDKLQPDYDTYLLLRECFRGGNTHANRDNANRIIKADNEHYIKSADRSSSYPDVQMNRQFPTIPFARPKPEYMTKEHFLEMINKNRPVIARLEFYNLRLKYDEIAVPYISKSNLRNYTKDALVEDNGRIIFVAHCEISVTDIDYKILEKQYKYDEMKVNDFMISRYGDLPECIKNVIRDYYTKKTKLKGDEEQAIIYMKSKNKLNSIYGNSAQDPGKIAIVYDDGLYKTGANTKNEGFEDIEDMEHMKELNFDKIEDYINYIKQQQFFRW